MKESWKNHERIMKESWKNIICVFLMKVYDMIWKWTWVGFGKIDSVRCADAFFQHLATRKSARVGGHAEPRLRRTNFTSFPTWRSWPTNMERRNKNDENTTWTRHEHDMNMTWTRHVQKWQGNVQTCEQWHSMAMYGTSNMVEYGPMTCICREDIQLRDRVTRNNTEV